MKNKKTKRQEDVLQQRKKVGIIISALLIVVIIFAFIGYKAWEAYNNSPEKIAQRFLDGFSVYNAGDMKMYSTAGFWKQEGTYYGAVSHALGVLADNIAKNKGLPRAMLKPQLKIEIPDISQWKEQQTATKIIYSYDGQIVLTFPESQTLSNARVPIHASFEIQLCKVNGRWRVCAFDRKRKYADWTVYEFIEARMAADTEHLEKMLCKDADESIKNYIDGYDIMVHDPAGDSNIAWVISHISEIAVDGNNAVVKYGLYKVSSQDPTNPVMKWKYIDVSEHLKLCDENSLWYIKSIHFEE